MNAVLLALSFIMLFLLASAAFAVVAVREHIQHVARFDRRRSDYGSPADRTSAPVAYHAGMSVVTERPSSRMAMLGDETIGAEELFKREPIPPLRTRQDRAGRA
jgi:hypothetical protein